MKPRSTPSAWREFAFALHQVMMAVQPRLALSEVLQRWNVFAGQLAENWRQRVPHLGWLGP